MFSFLISGISLLNNLPKFQRLFFLTIKKSFKRHADYLAKFQSFIYIYPNPFPYPQESDRYAQDLPKKIHS